MHTIEVTLTPAQLTDSGVLILHALNAMQLEQGLTVDQAITSALWAMGYVIAERGGVLKLDAPLREAMPGFVASYQHRRAKQGN